MILTLMIICIPLLVLFSVAVVQFTKATQVLFMGKEKFIGGIGGVFFIIQIIFGKDSKKYKEKYTKYVLKTMKPYAIISLIFSPIVIVGGVYISIDIISQLFT